MPPTFHHPWLRLHLAIRTMARNALGRELAHGEGRARAGAPDEVGDGEAARVVELKSRREGGADMVTVARRRSPSPRHPLIVVFAFVVLGLFPDCTEAQLRYVDKDGVVRWVQTPEQIPPEYRPGATQPNLPEIDPNEGEDPAARGEAQSIRGGIDSAPRTGARSGEPTTNDRTVRAVGPADEPGMGSFTRVLPFHSAWSVSNLQCFVSAPQRAKMLGPPRANFMFQECMANAGHPLE